jgi:hypothetical protein
MLDDPPGGQRRVRDPSTPTSAKSRGSARQPTLASGVGTHTHSINETVH